MVHRSPGSWLLGRLRALTRRGFDFADLVDAVEFRDFMLGAAVAPAGDERPWFGLETEARAIDFACRLAQGDGSGAPLGDKLALAIRLVRDVRLQGASPRIVGALKEWLGRIKERDLAEFSSLQAVVSVLERELATQA